MYFELFHPEAQRLFRGRRGAYSPYDHMFGGVVEYSGLVAQDGQPPVNLLFRLNTTDPAVGFKIPGSTWLPLLCAIRYGACDLGYRVISDGEVEILYQAELNAWDRFPYEGYPERLPTQPLTIEEKAYDSENAEDLIFYAAIFGYGNGRAVV